MNILHLSGENILSPFMLGLLFTVLAFLFSFFLVVGIKICILFSMRKNPFYRLTEKREKYRNVDNKKKRTKIRTLYVNPDEIDRICVKKD